MEIRELLDIMNAQARTIAAYLLPGGREKGREWVAGSIGGEPGDSLKVCIAGGKIGVWSDFATGDAGDLLDLWKVVRGQSLAAAIKESKEYLGIREPNIESLGKRTFAKPKRQDSVKKLQPQSHVITYLLGNRRLSEQSLAAYKISEAESVGPYESWKVKEPWKGPWIVLPSIRNGELIACKYLHLERKDGKKQTFVEANCEPCLFGWQAIDDNLREVVICEGELDAVSWHQYGFPALSVPFGGGRGDKQQWIDYELPNLDRFESIIVSMDNDAAGQEAVNEIVNRLGIHRCKIAKLPYKDANECLQMDVTPSKIRECVALAEYRKPQELVSFAEVSEGIIEEFYPSGGYVPGFTSPWERVPFRFRRSELSVWTGVNGHGKSLVLNFLMIAAAYQGEKVCIASLEMPVKKTAYRLIRQITGEKQPSRDKIRQSLEWMDRKFWAFNLVGTTKAERLLETFRFAYKRYGVKQFVVDSLMKCGIAEDDYKEQKRFVEIMCDFVNETDAHVHLVAHSRKHDSEDSKVGKLDIKGTGAISDLAWNTFSVWRNKRKEAALQEFKDSGEIAMTVSEGRRQRPMTLDEVKALPDAVLYCDKARNEEWEGAAKLFYHWPSMQYHDAPGRSVCYLSEESLQDDCPY